MNRPPSDKTPAAPTPSPPTLVVGRVEFDMLTCKVIDAPMGYQLLREAREVLREVLADSKAETDHGGRSTVDEESVAAMLAKLDAAL